nr:nonmuscle myosin II heavy chain [Hymenolepis microstoma]
MASPKPSQEKLPKVYLRNEGYTPSVPEPSYMTPYLGTPVTYKSGETIVYTRQPATMPLRQYQYNVPATEQPIYADDSTPRSGTYSEVSNDSRSRHSKVNQRNRNRRHHHHYTPGKARIEDPDGYWQVPHSSHSTMPGPYVTPGGRHLPRTPMKHTAGVQVVGTDQVIGGNIGDQGGSYNDTTQELEDYIQNSQFLPSENSKLMIKFHIDPTADMAANFGEELLTRLQAQCRAHLAKQRFREDEAVRIIQKNAAIYFDPWVRLFLVLKPHLKHFRLEEEIIQLKGELEKYKAMVDVLRYENVAYQDKISRLLTLLDQIQPGGTSSDLVSKLVKELSMAVADHQKQWRLMVAGLPTGDVNGVPSGISAVIGENNASSAIDPMTANSYKVAKENAEFYREQLEMLREDVEAQNARISQHYEEKIGVLSERVEQLQNMLTQESFRVERISGELETANGQLAEARDAEDELTNMVENLKGELNRYRMASANSEANTPGEAMIVARNIDNTFAAAPLSSSHELLNDKQVANNSALKRLTDIRNYLAENPEIYENLKDTPLGQGGEYDILSATDRMGSTSMGLDGTLGHSMNSVFHSQSHVENYHLGRSQELEARYEALQQKLEEEVGYREDLELEAQEMRNKISNLQRQVRRQRDEHEEEMVEREQAHTRRVRELDDMVDELTKEKMGLEKRCLELQNKFEELRQTPDQSDSESTEVDLRDVQAKLTAENRQYQKELDKIREEFEQYKRTNSTTELKDQLVEKDEKISQLEVSQRHISSDMEILNVRLQNANKLLDDNEQRLRGLTKERQGLMHRISQLESERDAAVREAASAAGKAGAERETAVARQRELEDLKHERAAYQKDMTDMKLQLMETSTKAETEKHALEKRLADLETSSSKREADLKAELDMNKEKLENLQLELSELHKVESATSTDNRHLKRQIRELQDSVENYVRRVGELERRNSDLSAEVERARASREASVSTLRDRQSLASETYEQLIRSSTPLGGTDSVEFSDEEVSDGETEGEGGLTSSNTDLRRRSGLNSTQTVDRYRNRSRHRPSLRSGPLSSTHNSSRSLSSYRQSPPVLSSSKDNSPLPPLSTSLARQAELPQQTTTSHQQNE